MHLALLVVCSACAAAAPARTLPATLPGVPLAEGRGAPVPPDAAPASAAPKPAEGAKPAEAPKAAGGGKAAEGTRPSEPPKGPAGAAPRIGEERAVEARAKASMTPEVKDLVDRMQAFYEKTADFQARFRQDYTYKAFKRTQTSTGRVTFKKPGLMRWEYEQPSPKTFVLSGDRVYAHDPDAMTLTRASLGTHQLSASVTFLWGQGKLADEFAISKKDCAKCQGTLLELAPLKPDPRFQKVLLEVDPKTAQVLRSIVIDPDGSENAISFLELKTNVGVGQEHFKLAPPPGTQVVDLTQPAPKPAPPTP